MFVAETRPKPLGGLTDREPIAEFLIPGADSQPEERACIRRYRESDRDAVRRICCDTGFLGRPIDPIYQDRQLFADLITGPYLEYEPDWALVAETQGIVAGYLLGSVSKHFGRNLMRSGFQTACRMLTRLVTNKYAGHPRSEQFVHWVLTTGAREQPKHPSNAAHLHFNLENSYRGRMIGKHIWQAYEQLLRLAGIRHYYGEFFSYSGRRPERVYSRYGFEVFDRRETTMFRPEISECVYLVCAHKRFA